MKNYNKVIEAVLTGEVVKATEYISPKEIIRAVRKRFHNRIVKNHNVEITLTIGKPNYAEREFVKLCQKAKEPFPIKFPIKKIQLKMYHPKPNKLKRK